MKRILFSLAALLFGLAAQAKIELSPLFTDNMVFQQNCSAPVWGKATPGAKVTVTPSWNGRAYSCTAGTDGRWSVNIDTPAGSYEKYTVTIGDHIKGLAKCNNPNCITNVGEPVEPEFDVVSRNPPMLRCMYCERCMTNISDNLL
jgi:hypothetical protein